MSGAGTLPFRPDAPARAPSHLPTVGEEVPSDGAFSATDLDHPQHEVRVCRDGTAGQEEAMTRIQLSGGVRIDVEADLEVIRKALEEAIERDTLLELRSPDGRVRLINPTRIEIVERLDQEADPPATEAPPRVPEPAA